MPTERSLPQADTNATPLTEQERQGLLLPVFTRAELNLAEADNITRARNWALLRRRPLRSVDVLTEIWVRELHRQMYDEVWQWAGRFRTSEKNIGVAHWQIAEELRVLLDDTKYWVSETGIGATDPDEIAIRLSHRAVLIHPFPNGNGRWSRLLGDVLIHALGRPVFTWGSNSMSDPADTRDRYIKVLQEADRSKTSYGPLMEFARS